MKQRTKRILSFFLLICLLSAALTGCIRLREFTDEGTDTEGTSESRLEEEIWSEDDTESTAESTADGETTIDPSTDSVTEEGTTEAPTEDVTTEEVTTEPLTEPPTDPPTEEDTTEPEEPVKKVKIYIDQGHNPHTVNTGAEGNGLKEQDITYAVGIALAKLLANDPRFEVRLSRPTADTVLGTTNNESLKARTDDANAWGADYFISIHANSHTTATAHGIEAFTYSNTGVGYPLGERIIKELTTLTGLENRGMKARTDLYVLRYTAMPAVLVEIGFISNPTEAALMGSNPELFAQGIYHGILAYFGMNIIL